MQADLLTKVLLPVSLFLIMFGLGLSLRLTHFKGVLTSPKAVGIGLIGQACPHAATPRMNGGCATLLPPTMSRMPRLIEKLQAQGVSSMFSSNLVPEH